jgi:Membrane carboxypeptidase (penicillin-binding protein)
MPEQSKYLGTRSRKPPKGWPGSRRVASFQAPPPSRFRRLLGYVFNVWSLSIGLFLCLGLFLGLSYYWFEFSDRIDRRLLSGEVFTSSAGIYSAPKNLKTGEELTLPQLIDYLKSAGYIEKNNKADASRSRYSIGDNGVTIEPGITGTIDGKKLFEDLLVRFERDGKSVAEIRDLSLDTVIEKTRLEPRILSTIAGEGDGRRKVIAFDDIPQHLVKAITVTEDRSFFEHYGVNLRGIARAFWTRYEGEENSNLSNQGGSSITQQLVKTSF